MYTITENAKFNSLEINFSEKPEKAVLSALKALKFRWNNAKKIWYGYTDEETARNAIEHPGKRTEQPKQNKYGVMVGDIFSASWGYEQTNVDFFQVVEIVGETSARVREVYLPRIDEQAIGAMASDRTYKLTRKLLPPAPHSVFIKNQERGDIKRIRPGFNTDPETARKNVWFKLSSFADAHKCHGETITVYESWYA